MVMLQSQCQKRFFQSGARNLNPGDSRVSRQQFAKNGLSRSRPDFQRIAIPANVVYPRQAAHGFDIERAHAANPAPGGAGLDLSRCSFGDNLSAIYHHDAVGKGVRFFEVMSREENGFTPRNQLANLISQHTPGFNVESDRGFVEKQNVGVAAESQRE
jgi:hypothetical protein